MCFVFISERWWTCTSNECVSGGWGVQASCPVSIPLPVSGVVVQGQRS